MFDFYYQQGNSRRRLFQAKGSHCSIGSARSNDLMVDSRLMSKRHAELRLEHDGLYLRDLGSLSGTWVNRERIVDQGPLSDLDEIEVGDISLSIRTIRSRHSGAATAPVNATPVNGDMGSRAEDLSAVSFNSLSHNGPSQRQSPESFHGSSPGSVPEPLPESMPGSSSLSPDGPAKGSFNGSPDGTSAFSSEESSTGSSDGSTSTPSRVSSSGSADSASSRSANGSFNQRSRGTANGSQQASSPDDTDTGYPQAESRPNVHSTQGRKAPVPEFDQAQAYWARIVHEQLLFQMDLRRKDVNRMSDEQLRSESSQLIGEIISSLQGQLPASLDRTTLLQNVLNEAVGLGPLEQYLADDSITEIMVNNYREIFVERAGRLERSTAHFSSDATVSAVIERIITPLGRRIDESSPIVDARLKDGSRVNAVIPPLALKGPSLTIRKFPRHRLRFADLISTGSVNAPMVEFLRVCVEMRKNIIVSGGTGSGKTTLLNVLSNFIPDTDRIVTIEDAAELKLVQPNLVSLESRPPNLEGKGEVPIRDLVRNALRMRPDRIVVGECRGGEAIDMLQAMNTGHDGSLTTIHANTPRDVLSRLEVLVLMAGMDLPVSAIREQVASAVDLIIQQTRFPCGSRKITRITEVVGVESGTVQLQDIFRFEQQGVDGNRRVSGNFVATGAIPSFYEELREIGVDVDLSFFSPRGPGGVA